MQRDAIEKLYVWKDKKDRKPLIIRGARQVGKTWLMKEFAKEAFSKVAYLNFEDDQRIGQIFQNDFDIDRIIMTIQAAIGVKVDTDTLIIFDEIQEAPRAITSLKYFCEKAPQYAVMAAGSLLGIAIHENYSFPVGKVDFLDLFPLSFSEFLKAVGEENLEQLLKSKDWSLISTFHTKFKDLLRLYYYIGGMPAVVASFVIDKDFVKVRQLQQSILTAYDNDFSKHAPNNEVPRIRLVWKSISAQLSKENKKFIYGQLKAGSRGKDYELAIAWLKDAGLVYKINRTKKGQIPLSAYEDYDAFKLFMVDVGLMGALNNLPAQAILDENNLFTDYKGALTEQYVLQQLKHIPDLSIYYWSAENSRGEIDFLVQSDMNIIPIEVKAQENLQSKSLRVFVEKNPLLHGMRFSMSPYRVQDWMTNVPLYGVGVSLL